MLREKIAKLKESFSIKKGGTALAYYQAIEDEHVIAYNQGINDVLALPELKEVVEKARKWDEAMQQTHYCDDCKAALLDQRILELECELVKYKGKEEVILNDKINRRYGMNQDYNVSRMEDNRMTILCPYARCLRRD